MTQTNNGTEQVAAEVPDRPVEPEVLPTSSPTTASTATSSGITGSRLRWLMAVAAGVLAVLAISQLWPGGDESSDRGPIEVTISPVAAVEVAPGQTWRPTGVGVAGETHGIAATSDGASVAGLGGTIVRLDADGGARGAVTLGSDETTLVSDLDSDDSGTVWALDAGTGRLFRIASDDSVVEVPTGPNALINARGIGMSADGDAWIASTASGQLVKIAADGAVTNSVAIPGRQASDVIEAPDGTLWIVDAEEIELVHLTIAGEVLHTVKPEGFAFTSQTSPHLAIVGSSLWVTDPEMSTMFQVDLATGEATGERVVLSRPGDVRISKPVGISADPAGRLWITDSTGAATSIVDLAS